MWWKSIVCRLEDKTICYLRLAHNLLTSCIVHSLCGLNTQCNWCKILNVVLYYRRLLIIKIVFAILFRKCMFVVLFIPAYSLFTRFIIIKHEQWTVYWPHFQKWNWPSLCSKFQYHPRFLLSELILKRLYFLFWIRCMNLWQLRINYSWKMNEYYTGETAKKICTERLDNMCTIL